MVKIKASERTQYYINKINVHLNNELDIMREMLEDKALSGDDFKKIKTETKKHPIGSFLRWLKKGINQKKTLFY